MKNNTTPPKPTIREKLPKIPKKMLDCGGKTDKCLLEGKNTACMKHLNKWYAEISGTLSPQTGENVYELEHTCKTENGGGACGCCTCKPLQPKSFFDMTDEEKKIIVDRAAKESTEEQIRKYGNPTQPPLQGKQDWEKRLRENFEVDGYIDCHIDVMIDFINNEIQSAIHTAEKRMIEEMDKLVFEASDGIHTYGPIVWQIDKEGYDKLKSKVNHSKQGYET